MPLTEAEINAIRDEAEKEYPDIFPDKFPHASRLSITTYNAARKEGYITALTKERERVKPLVEALEWYADRDNYLTDFYNCDLPEDSLLATAWSKGNIEVKAKTALTNYNKSLKQTPH